MIVAGGAIAGFGYAFDSLVVAFPLMIVGFGLMAIAVFFRKTEK